MMKIFKYALIFFLPILILSQSNPEQIMGFVDDNGDGLNDVFRDANGDGINDVNNEKYPHNFKFTDQDNDGINDNYQDADGDGVNDLMNKNTNRRQNVTKEQVIDVNGDWINDITGAIYNSRSARGSRYGFVLEEFGEKVEDYTDANGDGCHDFEQDDPRRSGRKGWDRFIDEDGDGISDGKGFGKHQGFPWEDMEPGNQEQGKSRGKQRGKK